MSTIEAFKQELTAAAVWQALAHSPIDDDLLEWPPDLMALTDLLLERSEIYRFAFSPPAGTEWPPQVVPSWAEAVADAGRRWAVWVEDRSRPLPDLLTREWDVFRGGDEVPLDELSTAADWRLCQALLTLHAIADEACAGLGVALTASHGEGSAYRARGRELLARTGTLAAEQATNPDAARGAWERVDRQTVNQAPWVPLVNPEVVELLSKRVGNYQYSPAGLGMLIDQLWVR